MRLDRWRRQDGMVREAVKYFAILVVLMVMVLDAIAVVQAQVAVRDNTSVAAQEARTAYVDGQSARETERVARSYIEAKGGTFKSIDLSGSPQSGVAVVKVTAERSADTYVYHYLTRLPWGLGDRVYDLLNPVDTGTASQ